MQTVNVHHLHVNITFFITEEEDEDDHVTGRDRGTRSPRTIATCAIAFYGRIELQPRLEEEQEDRTNSISANNHLPSSLPLAGLGLLLLLKVMACVIKCSHTNDYVSDYTTQEDKKRQKM